MKDQLNTLNTYFWNVAMILLTFVCWQKVHWHCSRVMPSLCTVWA